MVERLAVFEPEEAGQRPALHVALHPQGLSHIHRLVGEAAFVAWRLQGYTKRTKDGEVRGNGEIMKAYHLKDCKCT